MNTFARNRPGRRGLPLPGLRRRSATILAALYFLGACLGAPGGWFDDGQPAGALRGDSP
jgi:hypothetical protein